MHVYVCIYIYIYIYIYNTYILYATVYASQKPIAQAH